MQSGIYTAEDLSVASVLLTPIRHKLWILMCILVSLICAIALLSLLSPRYKASIVILLDPKGPDTVETSGEFVSRPVDSVKIGSVVSVIQSNQLLDRVVQSEHLMLDPDFAWRQSLLDRLLRVLTTTAPKAQEDSEIAKVANASEILRKMMTVTREGFTYVIKIDVVSSGAAKARRLAQAIGDAYLNDQLEAKFESARRNFNWLSDHLDEMKSQVIASEDAVQKVRLTYGISQSDQGSFSSFASQELAELNKQLIAAQAEAIQREARAGLAGSLEAGGAGLESLPEVSNSPVFLQLKQKQMQALNKLTETLERYGALHPEAIRAQDEVRAAEADVSNEIKRIVANISSEYKAAAFRVSALQMQKRKVFEENEKRADGWGALRQAQRVADADKRLYDSLLSRFKEVAQRQTIAEVEARVISPPRLPEEASFPRPVPFLLGGFAFGLSVGIGTALLRVRLDRTFTTPAQVERALDLPVLASVPLLKISDLTEGRKRLSLIEYTARNPISKYADSLRGIRLALRDEGTTRARIVNFASSMPNEGKSTLAASVAISSAMAGAKTILIDCDLRNSSVSRTFEVEDKRGIVDVLEGSSTLEDILVPTKISSLSIVPAGKSPLRPTDLVNSRRLKQLIMSAAKMADFVVIDSAAFDQVPDAIVPSQIADKTVMVVKWRASDRASTTRAIEQLQRAKVRPTGIVLNSVDLKQATKYGYGYGY